MTSKDIEKIIASLTQRQSDLSDVLKQADTMRFEAQIEMAQNERAIWQWLETLETTEWER